MITNFNKLIICFINYDFRENATNFLKFHHFISKRDMYPENCEVVDSLVTEMSETEIEYIGLLIYNIQKFN